MVSVGKHAAEHGKVYMMNLSAPFVCQFFKDAMHRVLPYADFVFGNESEARAYGDANDMHGLDLQAIALNIAKLPKVCVCALAGPSALCLFFLAALRRSQHTLAAQCGLKLYTCLTTLSSFVSVVR